MHILVTTDQILERVYLFTINQHLHLMSRCLHTNNDQSRWHALRASDAENVSIWWRHHGSGHGMVCCVLVPVDSAHYLGLFARIPLQTYPIAFSDVKWISLALILDTLKQDTSRGPNTSPIIVLLRGNGVLTGLVCSGYMYVNDNISITSYDNTLLHFSASHCTNFNMPDKMAASFQTIFSNTFSCTKTDIFVFKFHWMLFPGVQLTLTHDGFR